MPWWEARLGYLGRLGFLTSHQAPHHAAYPIIFLVLTLSPAFLAHENTFFFRLEDLLMLCLSVSCIFSQMRGTPRKAVGFTSCSVPISEPCRWGHSHGSLPARLPICPWLPG